MFRWNHKTRKTLYSILSEVTPSQVTNAPPTHPVPHWALEYCRYGHTSLLFTFSICTYQLRLKFSRLIFTQVAKTLYLFSDTRNNYTVQMEMIQNVEAFNVV